MKHYYYDTQRVGMDNIPWSQQDFMLPGEPTNDIDYTDGSGNGNGTNDELRGNTEIDGKDVFTYPKSELDKLGRPKTDDLYYICDYHDTWIVPKMKAYYDYYQGRHHSILSEDGNGQGRPDARICVPLPKKLVQTFNGFDSDNPVRITFKGNNSAQSKQILDYLDQFLNRVDWRKVQSDLTRKSCIYGYSYLYIYNDGTNLQLATCTPFNTIVVYDDTVEHNPIFAIRYSEDGNEYNGMLITRYGQYHFSPTLNREHNNIGTTGQPSYDSTNEATTTFNKPLPTLPVIEMRENNGRISTFGEEISLIDVVDEIVSQKANDNNALSNEYMVVIGPKLSKEQKQDMRNDHLLNLYIPRKSMIGGKPAYTPSVKFMAPNVNDKMQEDLLDRDIALIYNTAQVVDLSNPKEVANESATTATGIRSLFMSMKYKANNKDKILDNVVMKLLQILFFEMGTNASWINQVDLHHKLDMPSNILQEAQAYAQLYGKVPTYKALDDLSQVDDAKAVADQMNNHTSSVASDAGSMIQSAISSNTNRVQLSDLNSSKAAASNSGNLDDSLDGADGDDD